jgi:hypothetical protein
MKNARKMNLQLRKLVTTTALSMIAMAPIPSLSAVLTFDDISSDSQNPIPVGYGGFNWSNMNYLNSATYAFQNSGYVRGTVSGNYVAFNVFGNPGEVLTISSGDTFDFNSTYLTAAWNDNLNVNVLGFLNGLNIYNQTVVVSDDAPTLFNFNYLGIDQLRFTSFGGTDAGTPGNGQQFAMDNFTYNAQTVPEPATIALIGLGFMGFGITRRKSEKSKNA